MANKKPQIGEKYEYLTIVKQVENKNNQRMWLCECDCGKYKELSTAKLGKIRSCGCIKGNRTDRHGTNGGRKPLNLENHRSGRLTAIKPTNERKHGSVLWECKCDCGNVTYVTAYHLTSQLVQSCGCLKSIGESNIITLLQNNNINFLSEYNVKIDNNNRRFDFAIIEDNKISRLIEFDGPQHDKDNVSGYFKSSYDDLHQRDLEKNNWAKKQNIPLVRIPYSLRDNITIDVIFGEEYLVK